MRQDDCMQPYLPLFIDRSEMEILALEICDTEDFYELRDVIGDTPDADLVHIILGSDESHDDTNTALECGNRTQRDFP